MKLFIALCVLLTSVFGEEMNFNKNSNDGLHSRTRLTPSPWRNDQQSQYERLTPSYNSNSMNNQMRTYSDERVAQSSNRQPASYVDSNGLTPAALNDLFQSNRQNEQQENNVRSQSNPAEDSSLGYWSSYPDAAAFDAKVKARLGSSTALANKPEVRQKVIQLAEEKFNSCKGKVEDQERACLARSTGQIMQLVAAVENMARNQ